MSHPVRRNEVALTDADLADVRRLTDRILSNADVQAAIAHLRTDNAATTRNLSALGAAIATALGASMAVGLPLSAFVALVGGLLSPMISVIADSRAQLPQSESAIWQSVGASFSDGDALAQSRARAALAFGRLINESVAGDVEMARILGVDRTRVSQRVSERSLYAFDGPESRCFLRWQLHQEKPIRGLKTVLAALDPGLHPLTVDHWMTGPNDDLEIDGEPSSPVEWLTTGGAIEPVAELASEL